MEGLQIVPPPPDILPVIDKMASYVAKNGPAFEFANVANQKWVVIRIDQK